MPKSTRGRSILNSFLALPLLALSAWVQAESPQKQAVAPPKAAQFPKVLETHGETRVDNYFWMNDRNDPNVVAYLEAENAYAAAVMKPTEKLQAKLYSEMAGRLVPDEQTLPVEDNGYLYITRYEEGKEYPIHCRRKPSPGSPEEVMLDVNVLAAGHKLYKTTGLTVSPDNRVLAFGVDTMGNRMYTILFKDLATGKMLPDAIPGTSGDIAWAADSRTVFYAANDATVRAFRVMRHVLGEPPERDAVLFQENDVRFEVSLSLSKSREFVIVETASETSSETRYLDAGKPLGELKLFQARTPNLRYRVQHGGGKFYVQTDLGAPNFTLMRTEPGSTGKDSWKPVVPYNPQVLLEEFDIFQGYAVLLERADGLPRVRVVNLADGKARVVALRDEALEIGLEKTPEFASRTFRFTYASPVVPDSTYEYVLSTGTQMLLKRERVLGGYDPGRYEVRRVWARAPDGVRVPISLAFKKGLRQNGTNPTLLCGYGAYGSMEVCRPGFESDRISLLDRGFVYAIAHVRGGGELGRAWYE
ncbi:MAG TPA: prolyl oligopeptidase family serine peptidase, partial [Thermoanaerobaculaceae bacterium]|nr:prolyl oligopeptidase family serine peptidase [Thermoanaerobaculaceae bacterium]